MAPILTSQTISPCRALTHADSTPIVADNEIILLDRLHRIRDYRIRLLYFFWPNNCPNGHTNRLWGNNLSVWHDKKLGGGVFALGFITLWHWQTSFVNGLLDMHETSLIGYHSMSMNGIFRNSKLLIFHGIYRRTTGQPLQVLQQCLCMFVFYTNANNCVKHKQTLLRETFSSLPFSFFFFWFLFPWFLV